MLENSRWKVVACGEASLACRAAAQGAAYPQMGMYLVNSRMGKTRASYCRRTFFQKLGACDSVYGTVHCPIDLSIKLPFFFTIERERVRTSTTTCVYQSQIAYHSVGIVANVATQKETNKS